MGKRKEEKYRKAGEALEAERDLLTKDVAGLVSSKYGEGARLIDLTIQPMHRRVFSCEVKVRRPDGTEDAWNVVGKRSRVGGREYAMLKLLWDSGFDGAEPYRVRLCEPLAFSDASNTMYMTRISGHTVRNLLRESGDVDVTRHAARALLQMEATDLTVDRVHEGVQSRLVSLGWAALRSLFPAETAAAEQIVQGRVATELTLAHGDFHLSQVMVDDNTGETWLIDPTLSMAEPGLDAGKLLAHLRSEEELTDVEGARQAFLDEYLAHAAPGVAEALPRSEAIAYFLRAADVDFDEPEGPETAGELLRLGLEAAKAKL